MTVPRRHPQSRAYDDPTAQQLRSFAETARCGGVAAAAAQLGLSAPTVRQQIHALEKVFGESLLAATDRGSSLTEAGQLLAVLAGPLAKSLTTLQEQFRSVRATRRPRLRIIATPRIFLEDLPQIVGEFRLENSGTFLAIREVTDSTATGLVASGDADVALVTRVSGRPEPLASRRGFDAVELYPLTVALVTPRDHPLSRKREVQLSDLVRYPLVNSPGDLAALGVLVAMQTAGLSLARQVVEVFVTANVRASVIAGYGIGLIPKPTEGLSDPELTERPLTKLFKSQQVCAITRKGASATGPTATLVKLLRSRFG